MAANEGTSADAKVRKNAQKARTRFLKVWGVDAPEDPELKKAFTVGVIEWDRRHAESERTKWSFLVAQIVAPVSAAIATVLAATGISMWAVIPSAIATLASSLLASFGLRENWKSLRLTTRQYVFEISNFAGGWDDYRGKSNEDRIDLFIKRVNELSIQSALDAKKPVEGGSAR